MMLTQPFLETKIRNNIGMFKSCGLSSAVSKLNNFYQIIKIM